MDEQIERLRVSYRFMPKTVALLKRIKYTHEPVYSGRTLTWLIEYAIEQQYQPIIDKLELEAQS